MLQLFESCRRVSVPLVVVRTADQAATVALLKATQTEHPVLQWDAVSGITEANDEGKKALAKAGIKPGSTIPFVDALIAAQGLPARTILFVHNAQRQLVSAEPGSIAGSVQAVANLRDKFKVNYRMLVLLAPEFTAPSELTHDVVILDDPLPGSAQLATIIQELHKSAGLPVATADVVTKGADAVSGLSQFAAEQVVSMSLTAEGLNMDALWERKRVAIEQTPGLSVWRGKETFADLIGLDALKAHLTRRIASKRPIGVVVWIDEIDKALANVESDTSGVRMYQLLKLLTEMENMEWPGFVGVGVAGGGKSAIAKAFGNEAGVPTIALDLGATESKYVGESEANLIRVMSIIKAVGNGHAYFIATSNAATIMRPELQRRFFDGLWMFDLMTPPERKAAWTAYIRRYALPAQPTPEDEAWTGAEIRNACRYAADTGATLVDAAKLVIPMARSRAREIEELRQYAHGKFLDATTGGSYRYEPKVMEKQLRAIDLPPSAVAGVVRGLVDPALKGN